MKIGDSPTTLNAGSVLDLQSADKGLLMPRINLTATTTWGLAGTPAAGMHVYNTNVGITSTNLNYPVLAAKIGEYYWDGTGWVALAPAGIQDAPGQYSVYKTGANQTLPYTGTTAISAIINFTNEYYDKGDFNLASDQFIVPSNGAGYYQINLTGSTSILSYGQGVYISVFVNDSSRRLIVTANAAPLAGIRIGGSITVKLNAGDIVDFRAIATAPAVIMDGCAVDMFLISK